WPSIRDSNISTLITCAILFWFGNTFGASVVKGFAVTLAIGVGVSLFTAIVVTRSFLHLFLDKIGISDHRSWFGVKGV
ncbi:MAG: protein translocase subunit SecD, partial [Anaerolineales bacterium]